MLEQADDGGSASFVASVCEIWNLHGNLFSGCRVRKRRKLEQRRSGRPANKSYLSGGYIIGSHGRGDAIPAAHHNN
jgi:hypothetical protein